MTFKFVDRTGFASVRDAAYRAEMLLLPSSPMLAELRLKSDFKYESGHGEEIAEKLLNNRLRPIDVFFYRPWNPWTKAIGYYDGTGIYINKAKFHYFTHEDIVGLLLHEYAHHAGYKHGNNYKTQEKCLYSVPYYLSENVSRWL